MVLDDRPPQHGTGRTGIRRARGDRRPRRPVVTPGCGRARRHVGDGLAGGHRCHPQRATRAGGRSTGSVLGLVRAHVAARAAAQVRQHFEQGPVLLRRVGEPPRRRGIGDRGAAHAIVSALPAGPLRDITVDGVSDARLESLHRQRHALAAKFVAAYDRPFWRDRGQNGLTESEGILGSSWPQNEGVLSCLVPPERFAAYLSASARHRRQEALAELGDWFGPDARRPLATFERLWGTDPWTQGYVTQWRPGDVHRVGPLHGSHEPPFYVCGSDQWVAGYMEGAVRTGRAAAREALVRG